MKKTFIAQGAMFTEIQGRPNKDGGGFVQFCGSLKAIEPQVPSNYYFRIDLDGNRVVNLKGARGHFFVHNHNGEIFVVTRINDGRYFFESIQMSKKRKLYNHCIENSTLVNITYEGNFQTKFEVVEGRD